MKSYGITSTVQNKSELDRHVENIKLKGYSVKEEVISKEECVNYIKIIDNIYRHQELEFGRDKLELINELDMARMPFIYDRKLSNLFMHPFVLELTKNVLGKNFQLHLQNSIINKPQLEHHQTSWHRDLPYQDWVISKPLAFNAFYCLTDFTDTNGSTVILPYSHKIDHFPSIEFVNENELKLTAKAGSVIFFDSMLYHRASSNFSESVRYGVNNMFVVPIIKQQVNIVASLSNKTNLSQEEKRILGFGYDTPSSVLEYRNKRYIRKRNE